MFTVEHAVRHGQLGGAVRQDGQRHSLEHEHAAVLVEERLEDHGQNDQSAQHWPKGPREELVHHYERDLPQA